MTTDPRMRSTKPMNMDIDQLRGWAAFMDKAMIASLAAVIFAVAALGITTWLSFRFSAAVRAQELADLERYKTLESDSARSQREVGTARERMTALEHELSAARQRAGELEQQVSARDGRTSALERDISDARGRAAALEQEVARERERAAALEQEAAVARERAAAFEQAARDANQRSTRAALETTAASEKPAVPQFDAAEIQQRLADLGKLVRAAAGRGAEPPSASAAAPDEAKPSPVVLALRKYAGTKAAVYVVQPITDAQAAGSAISTYLVDSGWLPGTWTWTGVAGIFGVVVLVKDGSDAATNEAASALVEGLRSAGFNITKGDWPANWARFRGMLDGPQTPGPTDAPIRIVIGAKPR